MPLLMIVKRGKKLGSFLNSGGYTFVDDLGYKQATAVEIEAAALSGYVLVSVSHLLIPDLLAHNNMVMAEAVPALIAEQTLVNSDQVDYYLAIKPSERHLIQNITETDLKALWIDHEVLNQDLGVGPSVPAQTNSLTTYQEIAAALDIPMYTVSITATNTDKYVSDLPISISSGIWNQAAAVYNIKPLPAELKTSAYQVSDLYSSATPMLVSLASNRQRVELDPDTPAYLPENVVGYTLRWLPPIPVRIWDTVYGNQMYESSATAIVNFIQFFEQDLGSSTPKPIPIYKSAYVNTDKKVSDKAVPLISRVFNNLIKVEVLPNLTGSVTTQAYSNYSIILQPATLSTATLSSQTPPFSNLVLDSTFSTSTWQMQAATSSVLAYVDVQVSTTTAAKSSGFGAPISDGLVSNYDVGHALSYFGTGGTWKDLVGVNHMTITNMTYYSVKDGGFVYNGIGYALAADADNLDFTSALTIEAVIRPTALANTTHGMGIVSKGTATDGISGSYELMLVQSGSKNYLQFRLYSAGQLVASPKSIPIELGTISYVSATYDGSMLRVFVNSIEDGTGVAGSGNLQTNTGGLCIGSRFLQKGTSSTSGFYGTIYSARVYGRALSQVEIAANFEGVRSRYGI